MESWYDKLKDQTFSTTFLHLAIEEVQVLTAVIERFTCLAHPVAETEPHLPIRRGPISTEEVQQFLSNATTDLPELGSLLRRIDESLQRFSKNGAFFKCSQRSPKDVILSWKSGVHPKVINFLEAKGYAIHSLTEEQLASEHFYKTMVLALMQLLRVHNSTEVMWLLLCSERTTTDVNAHAALLPNEKKGISHEAFELLPRLAFCFREWNEEMLEHPAFEFRAFVCNNSLNALTQYATDQYSSELNESKDEVAERILNFFNNYCKGPLSQIGSYVIDFYAPPKCAASYPQVLVVELNTFSSYAGGSLFKWSSDYSVFKNGPFEFRIVTQPVEYSANDIPKGYLQALKKKTWYEQLKSSFHLLVASLSA